MNTRINSIYPNYFPIKVIGKNDPGFADDVFSVLDSNENSLEYSYDEPTLSKSGKYISLSLNINILSREHFDKIYKLLYDHPKVSFVL
ncbi:YbeD family protein [Candidatus Kinetoplastidibacterium galati]|uniref:Uncharacterized protein n=1 Tax=Candidatus Kinetoplastidibacterium galati TCC219 TaxID=1208921 RepID=M1LZ94_9PROT|nr:DUF493 domain-containing protein [Candidatus Kinetoplastibacterium galatii]AGF49386.1 hypothetical protein ST1E_0137 [Candidatus Kinetoplastibacterium galatii TCC219]